MATISLDPRLKLQVGNNNNQQGVIVEEIEGLIKVQKDGHIERPQIVHNVPSTWALQPSVTAKDVVIEKATNLWARIYVSKRATKLPLLVYFHGGGFCVGSASWICYHDFLANLASKETCVIISVNYRLAPENRLPSAYDDGYKTLMWIQKQALSGCSEQNWWLSQSNLSSLFLVGDSSGANIAYHVTTMLSSKDSNFLKPLCLKGTILIQPFFGGEARTSSEKYSNQPPNSALTLSASDTYWRLSLPSGANRDHPWCNPLANEVTKLRDLRLPNLMVCISEMDILKDRNLEFCTALMNKGKKVEITMYKGVGHAFQVLNNSNLSQIRVQQMMSNVQAFINQ